MTAFSDAVFLHQHVASTSRRRKLLAVLETEWRIIMRNPTLPMVVIGLLALCQLLMPGVDAPYAVVTVNHMKPVMTAAPLLLMAGTVFGAVSFPVYLLYLGRCATRDMATGSALLYASSPLSQPMNAFWLMLGRILSHCSMALASVGVVLAMQSVSACLRTGHWPGGAVLISYLSALVPPVLVAAILAVALDMLISSLVGRVCAAFFIWLGLLGLSAFVPTFDLFDVQFLAKNISPNETRPALAMGFISGDVQTIAWPTVQENASHLLSRGVLAATVAASAVIAAGLLSLLFPRRLASSVSVNGDQARPPRLGTTSAATVRPEQLAGKPVGSVRALLLLANQCFSGSGPALAVFGAALLLSAIVPEWGGAQAVALLIPIIVLRRSAPTQRAEMGAVLRLGTPTLWRPSPHVMESVIYTAAVILATLPAWVRMPFDLLRMAHGVAAASAASAWLVYTHRSLRQQLLGVSLYLLLWYVGACHKLPAMFDIFAIHGSSPQCAMAVCAVSVGLLCLVFNADRAGRA